MLFYYSLIDGKIIYLSKKAAEAGKAIFVLEHLETFLVETHSSCSCGCIKSAQVLNEGYFVTFVKNL
jgi:hypothetical protein